MQPRDEKEVTCVPSCVSAATEIAEGVLAYTLVLKSPPHSPPPPEPPEFEAAKITATPLSNINLSVMVAMAPFGS